MKDLIINKIISELNRDYVGLDNLKKLIGDLRNYRRYLQEQGNYLTAQNIDSILNYVDVYCHDRVCF